jgi:hypothetical protein
MSKYILLNSIVKKQQDSKNDCDCKPQLQMQQLRRLKCDTNGISSTPAPSPPADPSGHPVPVSVSSPPMGVVARIATALPWGPGRRGRAGLDALPVLLGRGFRRQPGTPLPRRPGLTCRELGRLRLGGYPRRSQQHRPPGGRSLPDRGTPDLLSGRRREPGWPDRRPSAPRAGVLRGGEGVRRHGKAGGGTLERPLPGGDPHPALGRLGHAGGALHRVHPLPAGKHPAGGPPGEDPGQAPL